MNFTYEICNIHKILSLLVQEQLTPEEMWFYKK
jgi:hypothetical protein